MRHLSRARIRKDFGQRNDAWLSDVGRIRANEIPLQFVEAVSGAELDEIGGDVAQGASQDRLGSRGARWQGLIYSTRCSKARPRLRSPAPAFGLREDEWRRAAGA